MNTYCPSCGKKIEYDMVKPKSCPHCETVLAKAFVPSIPPPVALPTTTQQQTHARPSYSEPFRGRNPMPQRQGAAPGPAFRGDAEDEVISEAEYDGQSEHIDRDEVAYRARILASKIDPQSFFGAISKEMSGELTRSKTEKLGEANPDLFRGQK